MADQNEQLSWDSEIIDDSQDFEPIPEGDYAFRVAKFERGQYNGGEKMGPCPVAKLELEVAEGEYEGRKVFENLYLNRKSMWKLASFFTCIGQRPVGLPKDEPMRMDWTRVPGSTGRAHIGQRTWKGRDGQERVDNQVTSFLPPDAPAQPAAPAAPANVVAAPPQIQQMVSQTVAQAQQQVAQQKPLTPGEF